MKVFDALSGIVAVALSCSPVWADQFQCRFAQAATSRFIPKQISLDIDPVYRKAVVQDRQFDALTDAPMVGQVVTANAVRQTLVWQSPLLAPPFFNDQYKRAFNLEFRLTIQRESGAAVLTYSGLQLGSYAGPDGEGRGEGKCVRQE